jgi:PAS domain S-box-containing protein
VSLQPVRVLVVDPEPSQAELARQAFERRGGAYRVSITHTIGGAREALRGGERPDIVIAEGQLPDGEGLDLLRGEPGEALPPVVIVTRTGTEGSALEALQAGAVDYVMKSDRTPADLPLLAERALAEIERRRTERELAGQRRLAESLLDMVASLVLVLDSSGRVVRFNRAAVLATGWSEDELRGRPLWEVLRPQGTREDGEWLYRGEESVLDLPSTLETEWSTRSGERRLVSWVNRPVLDAAGGPVSVICTGTDVTERRRLEADLRRAALEWRATFDGLPLGVLVVDAEGRVVRANRAAVEQSGRSRWSDLLKEPLGALGPGEPWAALGELVRSLRAGSSPPTREVSDSLSRLTWVVSARALAAEGEGQGRIVLNFQDVTETVRLKEQLRQSETMAEIGSLVAGVAHEVRNPLFSISATLDAFESRFGKAEGYDRYLGVLRGEIQRLTTLMRDLLDFGRPSQPDFTECRLEEVVEAAVAACQPLIRRKTVEVAWVERQAVAPVLADRARITQVFQNLIENAVHFSPAGGRVAIAVREAAGEGGGWIECAVADSGAGFDLRDLPRLFEPFFTRRRGGTGLGLSIVKRIVYDHGGEVSADNHPDGGAIVRVRLRPVRS